MRRNVPGGSRAAAVCLALALGGSLVEAFGQVQLAAVSEASTAQPEASSQEGPIRGPMLGYAFNHRESTLHPMRGILGASYVADPLAVGFSLRLAEASSNHDYALAVDAESGDVKIIDLTALPPSARTVAGAAPSADRIVLSPEGEAALLLYRREGRVQILTGLPESPSVRHSFDLGPLPGVLTALAVSDDGEIALAATSSKDSGGVYVLSPQNDPRLATPVRRALGLAFLQRSHDALIADYDQDEVLLVRDSGGSAQVVSVAGENDGILQPIAVASSAGNQEAIVASKASREVTIVPLAGGSATRIPCSCEPTRLARLKGEGLFQLTEAALGTVFVFDSRAAEPRIFFVPGNSADSARPPMAPARAPRARTR